jgi:serine phosphatase RsbU (regulator of sigma subunit)
MNRSSSPIQQPASVVVVDDEEVVVRSLATFLSLDTDYEIHTFVTPSEALESFKDIHVDVVISDFLMPAMNGLEFLAEVKRLYPDVVRILLTGYADRENAIRAINEVGLFQYVEKPWDNDQLILVVKNALNQRCLEQTLNEKVGELDRVLLEKDRLFEQQEQFREELALARRIQENLLPECFPDSAGIDFSAKYLPALEVGGDFYDVIPLADGVLGAIVADVTGHGIQAALSTTMLKSLFTDFVGESAGPVDILLRMNEVLHRVLPTDVFVAASVAAIDSDSGTIRVANGGGPHPFHIRRREKAVEPVITNGLLLGVVENELFRPGDEVAVELAQGDGLFFFTDGLTEVENDDGHQFGETRMRRAILEACEMPAPKLMESVIGEVRSHAIVDHKWDDITVLSVERSK